MGAFSSSQFFGAFLGASGAGWITQHYSAGDVFLVSAVLLLFWFSMVVSMRPPPYLSSELIHVGPVNKQEAQKLVMQLTAIRGVAEAVVIPEDEVAYLKVDQKALDREALLDYSIAQTE